MRYFITADQHFGHDNIRTFCKRPFKSVEEMDHELIKRHNEVVSEGDIVIHAGDFAFRNKISAYDYQAKLKGRHIFLVGSHDHWMLDQSKYQYIWEGKILGQPIVVCHYAMRTWKKSHYNSWQLFGHSHGKLEGVGKQMDIGVDTNNYYPYSWVQIKKIMETKEDNFNLIK